MRNGCRVQSCSPNTTRDSISRSSVYGTCAPRPPCGTRGVRARLRAAWYIPYLSPAREGHVRTRGRTGHRPPPSRSQTAHCALCDRESEKVSAESASAAVARAMCSLSLCVTDPIVMAQAFAELRFGSDMAWWYTRAKKHSVKELLSQRWAYRVTLGPHKTQKTPYMILQKRAHRHTKQEAQCQ